MKKTVFGILLMLGLLLPGARAEQVAVVLSTNTLFIVDTATTSVVSGSTVAITGITGSVVGIDMRPANGTAYVVTNTSRLYTLNLQSGAATAVSTGAQFSTLLSGATFGIDFNPVTDRLRITSDTGQSLVINSDTLAVESTGTIAAGITGISYTNSIPGATDTALWGLNSNSSTFSVLEGSGGGPFTTTFPSGNALPSNGFDISAETGLAYFSGQVSGGQKVLRAKNLTTGVVTNASMTLGATDIVGLTVIPEPNALGLLVGGLGVWGMLRCRWKQSS